MNRLICYTSIIVSLMMLPLNIRGQNGPDPIRALMFKNYANSAYKALKAQDNILGVALGQHIMTKEEVDKTTNLQKEFNEYLSNFDDILTIAAEIYAIYYEVDQAVKNLKELKSVTVSCPANTLAVALSRSKSHIYNDVIENGIQIANDVAKLLPISKDKDKNTKMTELERIQCISDIRISLRNMNFRMRKMNRLIRYTTLMDSWYELKGTYHKPKSMLEICTNSRKRWQEKAISANKLNTK